MKRSLLEDYDKILERLENMSGVSKEMVFNLLNIESKKTLIQLAKMTDKELIEALKD